MNTLLLYAFLAAFGTSILATPLFSRLAVSIGVVDKPDNYLKPHSRPTPYLGGVAVAVAIIASLLLFVEQFVEKDRRLALFFIAGLICMMIVGLLDDLFDLKPRYKIIGQLISALVLLSSGFSHAFFPWNIAGQIMGLVFILGACNSVNLLDGLDGLASGVSAIAALFFISLFMNKNDLLGAMLSIILAGALMGFLVFNYAPAKVFLGDAGSLVIGYHLSVLMIRYPTIEYDLSDFLLPLLICGLPVFDTALAYLRRWIGKKPIFKGDRSHFYDQLVDRGLSVKKTVHVCYGIGGMFGFLAFVHNYFRSLWSLLSAGLVVMVFVCIVVRMKMLTPEKK